MTMLAWWAALWRVNTKPVTGWASRRKGVMGTGFAALPDYYLPIESMPPIANAPYVHNFAAHWLEFRPPVFASEQRHGLSDTRLIHHLA